MHNLGMGDYAQDYAMAQSNASLPVLDWARTPNEYHRADGKVGARSYLGELTTGNWSATVAKLVAAAASRDPWFQSHQNTDGIVPIVHGIGSAMKQKGQSCQLRSAPCKAMRRTQIRGVLLIGPGCKAMQVLVLVGTGWPRQDNNFRDMTIQHQGSTRHTIESALRELRKMAAIANKVTGDPRP